MRLGDHVFCTILVKKSPSRLQTRCFIQRPVPSSIRSPILKVTLPWHGMVTEVGALSSHTLQSQLPIPIWLSGSGFGVGGSGFGLGCGFAPSTCATGLIFGPVACQRMNLCHVSREHMATSESELRLGAPRQPHVLSLWAVGESLPRFGFGRTGKVVFTVQSHQTASLMVHTAPLNII